MSTTTPSPETCAPLRILFVHGNLLTFTKLDLDILAARFEVRELFYDRSSVFRLAKSLLATLWAVPQTDVVLAWFGSYHALLPFLLGRLLGKRCLVISSGYDVAAEPRINYGNMLPGIRRHVGRAVFALAHRAAAVSHFAAEEAVLNVGLSRERICVIEHGVPDVVGAPAVQAAAKQPLVLTIGAVCESNLERKGMRLFVEAAALLPDVQFVLGGDQVDGAIDKLRGLATPNVRFTGRLTDQELRTLMLNATVYVQVSVHEAFGMALAEAMLSGCIPVVTPSAAIPEVVGATGIFVGARTAVAVAEAIRSALALPRETGIAARQRIVERYGIEKRRDALVRFVSGVAQ